MGGAVDIFWDWVFDLQHMHINTLHTYTHTHTHTRTHTSGRMWQLLVVAGIPVLHAETRASVRGVLQAGGWGREGRS